MLRPLGDFLGRAVNKTGARRSIDATLIVEATGPIILQMIPELRPADFKVQSYRDGTITIAVVNPTVGQELRFRTDPMLDVLREAFPDHSLKNFRYVPLIEEEEHFASSADF